MTRSDMLLAALTSLIWGVAFPASVIGLQSFSPAQLTAIRFLIACLPILLVPRPKLPWLSIVLIGLTLFTGQFLLLFWALTQGLPSGLASVSQQMQAFFTVLLAAVFLRDMPSRRQAAGMLIAFAGLALIGSTAGSDLKFTGLSLGLAGALSWAIGNVLVKCASNVPLLSLVVWCSLIPPLPAMVISSVVDERPFLAAIAGASWPSIVAAVYLGALATTVGYVLWGRLLQRYSTSLVAPFALLAPCVGVLSSAVMFGEVETSTRYVGMLLIVAGLGVSVVRLARRGRVEQEQAQRMA